VTRSEEFDAGYRMSHRPADSGPGLHEAERVYPDVHEHPEYYGGYGDKAVDRQSFGAMSRARGNPDKVVDMHRAVPDGVTGIHPGDWVTTSRAYAQQHLDGPMEGRGHVVTAPAQAQHLHPTGDYHPEYGYSGPPVTGRS
jgi:hypothetical protein